MDGQDRKKKRRTFLIRDFFKTKENAIAAGVFVFVVVVLGLMVDIVYSGLVDKIQLEMKFDSEKSFNTVFLSLSDRTRKSVSSTMAEEGVMGFGFYSTSGRLCLGFGDAPQQLPFARLSSARQNGTDSTMGFYVSDKNSHVIEYFRLSRLNVLFETGNLSVTNDGLTPVPQDFPEIIYVKFDGSRYFAALTSVKVGMTLVCALLLFFIMLSIQIVSVNRRYRNALRKNESLASLGAAARTLTHEIKNPLSAMMIQSALMRKMLPKEYHQDLDVFDHEIKRLTNLTNRVSDFLKNPRGEPVCIDLVGLIEEIIGLFSSDIPFEHSSEKALVLFDPDRARSVFENLIKNAVESRRDGSDALVSVTLSVVKKSKVDIRILDRGDGLPSSGRERMFDPFFTTKIHGSGIGLAISKQFVQAVDGTLYLSDRPDGGTEAQVVLPLAGDEDDK